MISANQNDVYLLLLLVIVICVFFFAKYIVDFYCTLWKASWLNFSYNNDNLMSDVGDILKLLCIVAFGYICWLLYSDIAPKIFHKG